MKNLKKKWKIIAEIKRIEVKKTFIAEPRINQNRKTKRCYRMFNDKPWNELNEEIARLSKEYARLKNKPKLFETETEKEMREAQIEKDKHEIYEGFRSLGADFEQKRDYILKLRKKVEDLKLAQRKDELEQKLKDQNITEKELLELITLINILRF